MMALVATLLLSVAGCLGYLRIARHLQILDHPNHRSSHVHPTPHGGGVPMLLAFASGMVLAALQYGLWPGAYLWLLGVALMLMLMGVLDDMIRLSVTARMSVYALSSLATVAYLVGSDLSAWAVVVAVPVLGIGLLWALNLYNFMDGIDGIAAVQCILAAGCICLLVLVYGGDQRYVLFCLLLVLAQAGFLFVNWPPARLFMGDAGSVPTGFLLGGLAILGWVENIVPPGCWLILGAPFIVDATWTLLARWRAGEPVTEGHRQHAYQRLARHWDSHQLVDLLLLALNAVWLFPLAWAAFVWPDQQWVLVILAITPLVVGMARLRNLT